MLLFFFKQKTAYEMRISDWSSDVCSSDLAAERRGCGPLGRLQIDIAAAHGEPVGLAHRRADDDVERHVEIAHHAADHNTLLRILLEIGRAACRARVCQSV